MKINGITDSARDRAAPFGDGVASVRCPAARRGGVRSGPMRRLVATALAAAGVLLAAVAPSAASATALTLGNCASTPGTFCDLLTYIGPGGVQTHDGKDYLGLQFNNGTNSGGMTWSEVSAAVPGLTLSGLGGKNYSMVLAPIDTTDLWTWAVTTFAAPFGTGGALWTGNYAQNGQMYAGSTAISALDGIVETCAPGALTLAATTGTGPHGAALSSYGCTPGGLRLLAVGNTTAVGWLLAQVTEIPGGGEVPEPGSLALLTVGLLGLAGARRRRAAVR